MPDNSANNPGGSATNPQPLPLRISIADANAMIPLYNGTSEDLHRFISCCESLLSCAMTEPDKHLFFTIIKSRLTGAAFDVFKYKDVTNWADLKKELIEQFQEERPRSHIQSELMRIKQGSKESIKDFSQRLTKVLTELNNSTLIESNDPSTRTYVLKENEKIAIKTFEDGLKSEHLKIIAKAKNENSLQKLITYITEHSLRLEEQNSYRQNNQIDFCSICNRQGHKADTCFQRKKIPTFIPTPQVKSEVNSVICAYCKKPNHHIRDCRSRLYNEKQRQQNNPKDLRNVRWSTSDNYSENGSRREEVQNPSSRVILTQADIHPEPQMSN